MNNKRGPIEDSEFTNKFFWQTVPNNAWKGKPCYIIGGGPSLEKQWRVLLPKLWGQFTIGINRAFEVFTPTIIFGMDPRFIRWIQMGKYGDEVKRRWDETSAYKVWLCTQPFHLPTDVYVLKCFGGYHNALHTFPTAMEQGIGHGQNSGYGALNLAACLGANPIYLLGYDMQREGDKTNWHDGHPMETPEHAPQTFRKHFFTAAKELKKRNIRVINLNPGSALQCFPKMELSEGFRFQEAKECAPPSPYPRPIVLPEHDAFSDTVVDNAWKGQRCFVIGEGESLKDFDFFRLASELTIGVNRAYERLDCTIMFATDPKFYKWVTEGGFGAEAKMRFGGFPGHKIWLDSQNYRFKGVHRLAGLGGEGLSFSLKKGIMSGENSEYGALNLAACLGANPIYLLGFDMKENSGKQAYWHDGYPEPQPDVVYEKYKKYFETAAPILKKKGIKVINLNPESELKCFEFGDTEKLEERLGKFQYLPQCDSKKHIRHEHDVMYLRGCLGFGDNFYQRPLIKDLVKTYKTVYLTTALPELYWDIPNVKFCKSKEMYKLWTHKKRMESIPVDTWSPKPCKAESDSVEAGHIFPLIGRDRRTKYIEIENSKDFDFSFPVKNEWVEEAKKLVKTLPLKGKKLCIIRRPSCRPEWHCTTRNPNIESYQLLIDKYKDEYFYLSLADVKDQHEWFVGDLHGLDKEFNKGEINLTTIFGLMKIADMTITYPSLFMIAAIAIRATCFTIYGGHARPAFTLRRNIGLQNFGHVAPEPFCDCVLMKHDCKKDIPPERVIKEFEELRGRKKYIKSVSVAAPPGIGDVHWVMTKMQSFKEKNAIDELKIVVRRDRIHHYTADYLKLVPFVDDVIPHPEGLNYYPLYDETSPGAILKDVDGFDRGSKIGADYLIDAGPLMEFKGTLLEDILPEYNTNFHYPIKLSRKAQQTARRIKRENKGKLVLLYASSVTSNDLWNKEAWTAKDWVSLATHIFEHTKVRPVLIGAEWDRTYAELIRKADNKSVIQYHLGEMEIEEILCLLQEANLIVAFPSGIPVMATTLGTPTAMFWPIKGISRGGRFDLPFQHTWVPPEIRTNGQYIPITYDDEDTNPMWIFNRIKEFL